MKAKNKKPIIVAMVGVVGSGKNSVARALARVIGAKVIEGDAMRVALRNQDKSFAQVRNIVEKTAVKFLRAGKSVILDSDFVDPKKRRSLESKAQKAGVKFFYVRTFADRDVMIGRLISTKYPTKSFFGGASSEWRGKNKGAVVALREMWRRTPHHYKWSGVGGGKWELRKLPIKFLAEIDTGKNWQKKVREVARKLR